MTSNLVSVSLWPQLTWESPLRDEAEDWKVGSAKLFYLSSISAKLTPTVFKHCGCQKQREMSEFQVQTMYDLCP